MPPSRPLRTRHATITSHRATGIPALLLLGASMALGCAGPRLDPAQLGPLTVGDALQRDDPTTRRYAALFPPLPLDDELTSEEAMQRRQRQLDRIAAFSRWRPADDHPMGRASWRIAAQVAYDNQLARFREPPATRGGESTRALVRAVLQDLDAEPDAMRGSPRSYRQVACFLARNHIHVRAPDVAAFVRLGQLRKVNEPWILLLRYRVGLLPNTSGTHWRLSWALDDSPWRLQGVFTGSELYPFVHTAIKDRTGGAAEFLGRAWLHLPIAQRAGLASRLEQGWQRSAPPTSGYRPAPRYSQHSITECLDLLEGFARFAPEFLGSDRRKLIPVLDRLERLPSDRVRDAIAQLRETLGIARREQAPR